MIEQNIGLSVDFEDGFPFLDLLVVGQLNTRLTDEVIIRFINLLAKSNNMLDVSNIQTPDGKIVGIKIKPAKLKKPENE